MKLQKLKNNKILNKRKPAISYISFHEVLLRNTERSRYQILFQIFPFVPCRSQIEVN